MHTRRNFIRTATAAAIALVVSLPRRAYAAYTKQSTRVDRVELNVTYDASGAISGVTCNAQIQTKLLVNDSDATDAVPGPWRPVAFNLLAVGNTTAATKTCNGTQVAALLQKIILDQATAQGVT